MATQKRILNLNLKENCRGAYWSFGNWEGTMLLTVKKWNFETFWFKCEAEDWRGQIFAYNDS